MATSCRPRPTTCSTDDHSVTGWTGISFDSLPFNGLAVPVVAADTRAKVAPALLSGHEVDAPDQLVLGTETLSELHKRVCHTVRVSGGSRTAVLRMVGVATMPTVGIGFAYTCPSAPSSTTL